MPNQWSNVSLEERFFAKIDKSPCGCWIWTGTKSPRGYGFIKQMSRTRGAHRVSYELHKGSIPDGLFVCHTCDNPSCVNPDHLYAGDAFDNMRDKHERGRGNVPAGETHWKCKITDQQVIEIRNSDESGAAIARRLKLSPSTVHQIRKGVRRKQVNSDAA